MTRSSKKKEVKMEKRGFFLEIWPHFMVKVVVALGGPPLVFIVKG